MIFGNRVTPRYILRSYPAQYVAAEYAKRRDWEILSEIPEDQDRGTRHAIVWLTQTTLTFHYEEDYISSQAYVFLAGDDLAAAERLAADLVESLSPWTREELLDAIRDAATPAQRGRALLRAALGAPSELDEDFYEQIASGLTDQNPRIRGAAVLAATASPRSRFRPLLNDIAARDPDTEVREMAQAALRAYDEYRIGEP
jgi:hypothetical protein